MGAGLFTGFEGRAQRLDLYDLERAVSQVYLAATQDQACYRTDVECFYRGSGRDGQSTLNLMEVFPTDL